MNVWLIGAGIMARDYAKVLLALGADTAVIGRGEASALRFREETGLPVFKGGLSDFLEQNPPLPDAAIVSVGVEGLAGTTMELLRYGVRTILVEKPAALVTSEMRELHAETVRTGANVFVAYNRRFYASTLRALEMIEEDGGLQSCNFEFTEWGHEIEGLVKAAGVKDNWFISNSTHVVDLAYHLGGNPVSLNAYTVGGLSWHPAASIFAGAGVTDRGVVFSYQANWGAPGRWGVEALTGKRRLIFRPMESLQVMHKGTVRIEPVEIDDSLDKAFKPGLYQQVNRFLAGNWEGLCTTAEQLERWPLYCRMAGYDLPSALP
jgi:Predicted dehydrogenases and related proteins